MNKSVKIAGSRENQSGTDLIVHIPDEQLGHLLNRKHIRDAELMLDDGRHISASQRRKA